MLLEHFHYVPPLFQFYLVIQCTLRLSGEEILQFQMPPHLKSGYFNEEICSLRDLKRKSARLIFILIFFSVLSDYGKNPYIG